MSQLKRLSNGSNNLHIVGTGYSQLTKNQLSKKTHEIPSRQKTNSPNFGQLAKKR